MKTCKTIVVLAAMLLATTASDFASARRGSSGHSARPAHSAPARPARPARSGRLVRPAPSGHSAHFFGRARIGVFLGAPVFAPLYYPPSGYYYDPSLPSLPPVYIEQEPASNEPAPQPSYWYYCPDSKTYYPYVEACAEGWQQVVPPTAPPS